MQNELARLPGVGNVVIFGSGSYAMRIWLDPKKMYAFSLNPSDVLNAIKNQNKEISAGQIAAPPTTGQPPYQLTVNVPGQLANPDEFANIIVKTIATKPNQKANASTTAQVVRIRDVGRVELGSSNYSLLAKLNNKPTAAIGIYQLPGANALQVAMKCVKLSPKWPKNFLQACNIRFPLIRLCLSKHLSMKFIRPCLKQAFWFDRYPCFFTKFSCHSGAGNDRACDDYWGIYRHVSLRF